MRKTIVIYGLIAIAVVVLIMKSVIPEQERPEFTNEEKRTLMYEVSMEVCLEKGHSKEFCECVHEGLIESFGLDKLWELSHIGMTEEDTDRVVDAGKDCFDSFGW